MQREELIQALEGIVGADRVVTEKQAVLDAAKDYIGYRRYQRDDGCNMAPVAACVVRVADTAQVAEVLKFLNEN